MSGPSSTTFAKLPLGDQKDFACYGLEIVCESLAARGHMVHDNPGDENSAILTSVYWPGQVYDLVRWLKQSGIEPGSRTIVAGGNTATANPAALFPWVSHVHLGDGERWDGGLDGDNVVTSGSQPKQILNELLISPRLYVEKQIGHTYIEISRGCKYRCLFCQYGWLKPYREANLSDVLHVVKRRSNKKVRICSVDRFQYSSYGQVKQAMDRAGLVENGSDISVRFALRYPDLFRETKRFRTGIEGMSERLRRLVGKPITDEHIVDVMRSAAAAGLRQFDWYLLYGLPGENDEDAEAFVVLLNKVGEILQDMVLGIHWNAFQPNALTPMQWCAPAYDYPEHRLRAIERHRVPGMRITHRPLLTSRSTMLRRMLAVRGSEATARLTFNVATRPNLTKDSPDLLRREFERAVGFDCMSALPTSQRLPWDSYVEYDREKLANIYNKRFAAAA